MAKSKYIGMWITDRMYQQVKERADSLGISSSEVIRLAITKNLMHPDLSLSREVVLSNSTWPDRALEYLAARRPVVNDLYTGGALDSQLKKIIYRKLSNCQAKRLEKRLTGSCLVQIASDEGCSKQAVHMSLKRALQALRNDEEFINALCDKFPESGITPEILMRSI
tara:strand:+ start:17004 stop:17504 length:501 start_codon:yes stop_codon:yes gene_type:complete